MSSFQVVSCMETRGKSVVAPLPLIIATVCALVKRAPGTRTQMIVRRIVLRFEHLKTLQLAQIHDLLRQ